MTRQEIIDLFDSTQITMAELARISGRSIKQLKAILTET
jgi:predicted HTH domain antitoxin